MPKHVRGAANINAPLGTHNSRAECTNRKCYATAARTDRAFTGKREQTCARTQARRTAPVLAPRSLNYGKATGWVPPARQATL